MNEIDIIRVDSGINWEAINEIYIKVEFGNRGAMNLQECFSLSKYKSFAIKNNKIIGFGRMLSDGKYYGAIYDVIVDPEYHGNGIGKLIMNDIIDQGKHMTYVTLFAVPGKLDFYQRLGFKKMSTAMIIPRNENMENIYCEC